MESKTLPAAEQSPDAALSTLEIGSDVDLRLACLTVAAQVAVRGETTSEQLIQEAQVLLDWLTGADDDPVQPD